MVKNNTKLKMFSWSSYQVLGSSCGPGALVGKHWLLVEIRNVFVSETSRDLFAWGSFAKKSSFILIKGPIDGFFYHGAIEQGECTCPIDYSPC